MPDDSIISSTLPKPKAPLWKRVRAWTVIVCMYAVPLGMVWFAGTLLVTVIKHGTTWDDRLFKLMLAAVLLVIPINIARVFIKRRLITGRWFVMTEQDKERLTARRSARQCGTTPAAACSASRQGPIRYAFDWAGYTTYDKTAKPAKRALAWTMILLHAAYVIGFIGFGLVSIGAAFANDNTIRQRIFWLFIGLAALIFEALDMRPYWRRFQATGSLHVSKEELQAAAAQLETKRNAQRQRPLRSKIISAAIVAAMLSVWWIRVTVYHSRHPRESWVSPAVFTITWLYSFWSDFRKPPINPGITEPVEL